MAKRDTRPFRIIVVFTLLAILALLVLIYNQNQTNQIKHQPTETIQQGSI